ncbi:TPA: hypothetical protein ENS27_15975, partial [bacterium]|nr:hypothetical protein [bacterium]
MGGTPYDPQDPYGNLVAGFEILALDNMSLSAGDYARLCANLENVLNAIAEDVNLQFSSSFDYFPYRSDFVFTEDPTLDFFKQQRHKYYGYFKYLTCHQHLFVDFDAGRSLRTPYNIFSSSASIKTRLRAEHERLVAEKNNALKTLQAAFEGTGIKLRRLRNRDLATVLYRAINLSAEEFSGTVRGNLWMR